MGAAGSKLGQFTPEELALFKSTPSHLRFLQRYPELAGYRRIGVALPPSPPKPIPAQNMAFVDLEQGRRWADYAQDEPLPEILFGIKVVSPPPEHKEEDGWQTVKKKQKKKSEIRRPARIR